jgi:putative GTP pyrophosphokinase
MNEDNKLTNANDISELMLKYNFALQTLETQMNILIKEYEFKNKYNPVEHIKSRIKTQDSAIAKLKKKGYEPNANNLIKHIHDMIGIRIVCSFISDVYDIVDIIKKSKQFKIKSEKDYILNPKESGYMSYHLIVLIPIYLNEKIEYVEAEIQIRTIAMDFWASLDHKIHYKFPKDIPEEVKEELYNCSLDVQALDDKMYLLNEIVKKYND